MRRYRAGTTTPRVILDCVADSYSTPTERVIEFAFPDGRGGLIRFHQATTDDERQEARIELSRIDPGVRILGPGGIAVTTTADGIVPSPTPTHTPTPTLDDFRVAFHPDASYAFEEADGGPMPATEARYQANGPFMENGKPVSYERYRAYYGNPDRHVVVGLVLQRRCACCGTWDDTDTALWGIDFMDDSPEVARMPDLDGDGTLSVRDLLAVDDYLAATTRELLQEAGVGDLLPPMTEAPADAR